MCCKPSRTVYESVRWSERLTTFTKASHFYMLPPTASRLQRIFGLRESNLFDNVRKNNRWPTDKKTINKCCFLGAFKHTCTAQLNY